MWAIVDVDEPGVASDVYAGLLRDGNMDCRGAAKALHKAVANLRGKIGRNAFERWAPIVHIGL